MVDRERLGTAGARTSFLAVALAFALLFHAIARHSLALALPYPGIFSQPICVVRREDEDDATVCEHGQEPPRARHFHGRATFTTAGRVSGHVGSAVRNDAAAAGRIVELTGFAPQTQTRRAVGTTSGLAAERVRLLRQVKAE